ncbi:MAG: cytochrome P450 [Novosphingobium sp.]|nr:cytochrome P450 [Novosphingobium sp.]
MSTGQVVMDGQGLRTGPTAQEAIDNWEKANSASVPHYEQRWDVTDPALYAENRWQDVFREMRQEAPVNFIAGSPHGDYWNVVALKAVQYVEALPLIFSSDARYGGFAIDDFDKKLNDGSGPSTLLAMDPPEHTPKRRTIAPAFTPAEMVRLSDQVRQRTGNILDSLPIGEQFDWVEAVSVRLTTDMLAVLFDFPWEHRQALTFWSDWMSDNRINNSRELLDQRIEIMGEMAAYMYGLWQKRLNEPEKPDLLSRMIHSDAMGNMDPAEFMSNMAVLIVGGNDTTRNTMTGMVEAFDSFPGEWAKLEADPSLIPNAIQELIRYVTPVSNMRRTATEDHELEGQLIRQGDKVVMWYISANRDESVFDEPDRLIVDRPNARRHVSFGYGVHRCIGARLAELQLRILIEEMLARKMRVSVTGKVERLRQNFINGFASAEVTVERG